MPRKPVYKHSTRTRREVLSGAIGLATATVVGQAIGSEKRIAGTNHLTDVEHVPGGGVRGILPTKIYGNDAYPVHYRKALPINAPRARYTGFKPGATLLRKGTLRREGAKPLSCDIIFERDVPVKLRDGTVIYTDVFRPTEDGRYPAIVAWSPYGKEVGGQWLDDVAHRSGVALSLVSELQKFEGPDPAFWVAQGYVVLNPDARGAYSSNGNINYWGRQLAEDGYDYIEWASQQPWSSGNIGLSGNSWLAASQWFIAAERPPHLKAIAPWEGFSDHFRETGNRGGIPAAAFPEAIIATFSGKNLIEDQPRMIVEQQLMSPYWEDKTARLEKIEVPAYVVASYTNPAHTHGTFEGFRRIGSQKKWLRVHNTNEWLDYYTPKYTNELLSFFDHFLKGKDNNFEETPRVRISVLDPSGSDIVDRIEDAWPPVRFTPTKLFLSDAARLLPASENKADSISYSATDGSVSFEYAFDQEQELVGYMKLHLWVEAEGSSDMELSVTVEKRDAQGKVFAVPLGEGATGILQASGLLRVSQRELDQDRSTESEPYLLHRREQLLSAGQVVPVEIGIWPIGLRFKMGERLHLTIAPHHYIPTSFDMGFGTAIVPVPRNGGTFEPGTKQDIIKLGGAIDSSPAYVYAQRVSTPESRNHGRHKIHFGGKFDSYLLVPLSTVSK